MPCSDDEKHDDSRLKFPSLDVGSITHPGNVSGLYADREQYPVDTNHVSIIICHFFMCVTDNTEPNCFPSYQ